MITQGVFLECDLYRWQFITKTGWHFSGSEPHKEHTHTHTELVNMLLTIRSPPSGGGASPPPGAPPLRGGSFAAPPPGGSFAPCPPSVPIYIDTQIHLFVRWRSCQQSSHLFVRWRSCRAYEAPRPSEGGAWPPPLRGGSFAPCPPSVPIYIDTQIIHVFVRWRSCQQNSHLFVRWRSCRAFRRHRHTELGKYVYNC